MCENSGRLIAWLDRELPDQEASNVERHVGQCAECRKAVSRYAEVSDAFLVCYEAVTAQPKPHPWRWVAILSGVAAAAVTVIVAVVLLAQPPAEKLSFHPPLPPSAPIIASRTRVHVRRQVVQARTHRQWVADEPMVEVSLPADALFPPGAVPQGFSFIADVRLQQ